jgi:N-acetylglucosamine kinase-like BadF-type ATPase
VVIIVFLGVDGGGTKTAFLLIDENGQVLSRTMLGSLDWFQIGADGFQDTLDRGIAHVCWVAGIERSQLFHTVLGIPGLGDDLIEEQAILLDIVGQLLPNGQRR